MFPQNMLFASICFFLTFSSHGALAAEPKQFPLPGVWGYSHADHGLIGTQFTTLILKQSDDGKWYLALTSVTADGFGHQEGNTTIRNYGPVEAVISDHDISLKVSLTSSTHMEYTVEQDGTLLFREGKLFEIFVPPRTSKTLATRFSPWSTAKAKEFWNRACWNLPLRFSGEIEGFPFKFPAEK